MICSALWRRLDRPGHDAARLAPADNGWSLRGTAVFRHETGPACVTYAVDLDATWKTVCGEVSGFLAGSTFRHVIARAPDSWYLDGNRMPGLEQLVDLDYGFTPATNLQQLRRVAIGMGQAADVPVAWFDVGHAALTELPQRYERRGETTYWYVAPSVPYEGLLELAPSGFARSYPRLWKMVR